MCVVSFRVRVASPPPPAELTFGEVLAFTWLGCAHPTVHIPFPCSPTNAVIHSTPAGVPPVQVEVVEQRRAMALDENEGVYVRDQKTGQVRSVVGQSYMLSATEVLWEKELPPIVEELLQRPNGCKHTIKDKANLPIAGESLKQAIISPFGVGCGWVGFSESGGWAWAGGTCPWKCVPRSTV